MDEREEAIHQIRDIFEVGWYVLAHVDWVFSVSPSKLSYVRNGSIVERPQCVFVERIYFLLQSDFDAIGQEIVLPQKVLFLNPCVQRGAIFFAY